MIAFSNESLIVMSLGCLVLNYFAFRTDAEIAGHGRKQMLRMAAIWITIFAALTVLITWLQS